MYRRQYGEEERRKKGRPTDGVSRGIEEERGGEKEEKREREREGEDGRSKKGLGAAAVSSGREVREKRGSEGARD